MQSDRKHLNLGRSIPFSPCKSVPIFLIYGKNALINLSLLGAASFKTITSNAKDTFGCPFCVGCATPSSNRARCAVARRSGSHSPPEDRPARLSGAGRANSRRRRDSGDYFLPLHCSLFTKSSGIWKVIRKSES